MKKVTIHRTDDGKCIFNGYVIAETTTFILVIPDLQMHPASGEWMPLNSNKFNYIFS